MWPAPCAWPMGQDPDKAVSIGTDDIEPNASGIGYRRTVKAPAWTTYADEARRMIAAVRAMGLLE